jgi:hypothetical protein
MRNWAAADARRAGERGEENIGARVDFFPTETEISMLCPSCRTIAKTRAAVGERREFNGTAQDI